MMPRRSQGEATFLCRHPGCGKAYATSDAARKHVRNHHPEWLKMVEQEKRGIDGYCKRIERTHFPMDMMMGAGMPWQQRAAAAMSNDACGVVGPAMMAMPGQVMCSASANHIFGAAPSWIHSHG